MSARSLAILLLTILIPVCDVAAQVDPDERTALIALYNATNGPGWSSDSGWDTAIMDTECTWHGVTCAAGHVTVLRLPYNRLSGSVPSELGNLSSLTRLWLYQNQLTGNIPPELGDLSSLQWLNLWDNQLTGSIPPELGDLSSLQHLNLIGNQLTGTIPPELGNLSSLTSLALWGNQLTGNIPPELGDLSYLGSLYLSGNQLNGNIPPELGDLSYLQNLNLSGNQLTGSIPPELGNLSGLSAIYTDIDNNALHTDDPVLQAFLDTMDPGWDQTQTIAPADVAAGDETGSSFVVSWTPILYTADDGWYLITAPSAIFSDGFEAGNTSMWGAGGPTPIPAAFMTVDKTDASILVDGLQPATEYQFVVRTVTEPHANNQNRVISEESEVVFTTTTP